jgi:hypothetical protein
MHRLSALAVELVIAAALALAAGSVAPASATPFAAPPPAWLAVTIPDTAAAVPGAIPDTTMHFTPAPTEARRDEPLHIGRERSIEGEWRRAPFGDQLLTHPDVWRSRHSRSNAEADVVLDYNRVDLVRYGVRAQAQQPETMDPRVAGRLEYATGRKRTLYGVQVEQPLLPTARVVLGIGFVRRTDHGDLEQIDDDENSLLLLVAHEDWRDYFEREGAGAYVSWRVPDFSTVSVHLRNDRYRSIGSHNDDVVSWWHLDRPLRPNPAIDEGDAHSVFVRLERVTRRSLRSRSGLYHWIELERSGGPTLRGDFDYTRALADLRSDIRMMPGTTLTLRTVGGTTFEGKLPRQREFAIGGVDGLRAHSFGAFRGDRVAMGQAEYSFALRTLGARARARGPRALVFVDSGTAWQSGVDGELARQHFALDGGFGLATPDDEARLTFARNLQNPDSQFVIALRLERPF